MTVTDETPARQAHPPENTRCIACGSVCHGGARRPRFGESGWVCVDDYACFEAYLAKRGDR